MPRSKVFNISLNLCQFPDTLKIAKIISIHISEDKKSVGNYRPISVLPYFSKIGEKLMYDRLLIYLNINNILVKNQYGFRDKHSTYMALLQLADDISNELDLKNNYIGILLIYQKRLIRLIMLYLSRNYSTME